MELRLTALGDECIGRAAARATLCREIWKAAVVRAALVRDPTTSRPAKERWKQPAVRFAACACLRAQVPLRQGFALSDEVGEIRSRQRVRPAVSSLATRPRTVFGVGGSHSQLKENEQ